MFYLINKEKGTSSFKAIKKFAKENNITKIGHCGTLDPLAFGLLIVATNEHTKLIDYIDSNYKAYEASAKFHYSSLSYDEGSKVNKILNHPIINKTKLKNAINNVQKTNTQIPPIFSAKKINGIRSYEYARKSKEIDLKPIKINIKWIKLTKFNLKKQEFSFKCLVSKGTYVRTIVHDIGLSLKTDAVVTSLYRSKIGNIKINSFTKNKKINNYQRLFNVKLFSLAIEDLFDIFNKKDILKIKYKNVNDKYLFMFKKQIIAYGKIEFGYLKFAKVFYSPIEAIIKQKKAAKDDKV